MSGSLIATAFLETVLVAEFLAAPQSPKNALRHLHAWWRRADKVLGPASSARAVADAGALPFVEILGYHVQRLEPHGEVFVGILDRTGSGCVLLLTTRWATDPERIWRDAVRAGRVTGARWGLVFTGPRFRIVDARRSWARRSIEFEIQAALSDERSAVCLAELVAAAGAHDQHPSSLDALVARSDSHGVQVCTSLGQGVLEALTGLVTAFDASDRHRSVTPLREHQTFEQAVTIAYRLLFLLFAESRALVPTWHRIYRDAYTVDALCQRAVRQRHVRGLWKAVQAISRLAHAGCRAGDLVVTPFNGRLFSPRHTPLGENAVVPDDVVGRAIVALATTQGRAGRQRIAYADLDVEQLGSVYERVLEYEPARNNGPLLLKRTSLERKASGSFYTPRVMTDFVVRRTLHPLVAERSAEDILKLRVLDPAMGSGAFLVSACRYLARAAERSLVAEGSLPADEVVQRRPELRREVAQRCVFGVDVNPMAVQLARLSLWLTTLANDRPLTFLDHHLASGDSLIGAMLDDLTRPTAGSARPTSPLPVLPLFADEPAAHLAARVLPGRFRVAMEPGNTPEAVREKEKLLASLSAPGTPLARLKQVGDLWCASWFLRGRAMSPGMFADLSASLIGGHVALHEKHRRSLLGDATAIAHSHRFFHWELEFPEVFFDRDGRRAHDGGFDAVLGNPPWDVLRADTGDKQARARSRDDRSARLRYFRDSRVYRCGGRGHANRYQLFLERALQLTRPGGRIGLILPSGLATDHGSAPLRREVLNTIHIDRLIGFDNREAIFPIHRDVKFVLVTGSTGRPTDRLSCAFGQSRADWLDRLPDAATEDPPETRRIVLSRSLLEQWDPDHLGIPLLTCETDLEILAHVSASIPRLGAPDGWHVRFGRELNATEDRRHFTRRGLSIDELLVVEGKHLEPFRLHTDATAVAVPRAVASTLLDAALTFERSRIAYRDVASATNRVTLIAAVLPANTISTHTLFCLKTPLSEPAQYVLLAIMNSLVANYLVRLQVTTHVTTALMARLPVPKPRRGDDQFRELSSLAKSLEQTGVAGNESSYVRINTIVAELYGLTATQYEHVVATFPLLPHQLRKSCVEMHRAQRREVSENSR